MNNLKHVLTGLLGLVLTTGATAWAAPLTEAELTRVYHEVSMVDPGAGKRPAAVHDVVKGNLAVETGLESRAELLFPDNTLTRLASNTYFSFKEGTREMDLGHGAILFQIPHGVGGAKINTAAITAAITGTTGFVEKVGNTFKLVLLEGTVRVYLNDRVRESMIVHGGQMLIAPSNAHTMKDWSTVDFDVAKMMKTSVLLKPELFKPLPPTAMNLITEVIQAQQGKLAGGELNSTNLVIAGGLNTVLLVDNSSRNRFSAPPAKQSAKNTPTPSPTATASPTATPTPTSTPLPTPDSSPTPNPNPTPSGTPTPPPPVGYITDNTTVVVTNNTTPTITTQGVTTSGVLYKDLMTNGSPSAFLFGTTSTFDNILDFDNLYGHYVQPSAVFVFDSLQLGGMTFQVNQGVNSVTLVGNMGITNSPGTTIDLGGIGSLLLATQAGNITLDSGIAFTSSLSQPNFFGLYARGGDLMIGSSFQLPSSNLTFAAENNALFTASSHIDAKNVNITGLQSVQFDGTANTAQVFQINGGTVEVGGTVTSNDAFVYGTSAAINGSLHVRNFTSAVTGDFALSSGGSIITASDANTTITSGGNLTLDGTVSTHKANLTATGGINLNGTFTTNDLLSVTSNTATVNGTLNLAKADFETTGNFLLGGTGVTTTSQSTIIHANGGGITLDGGLSGPQVTLTATGDIAINHAITSSQLLVTGKSISFGTDLTASGSGTGNDLTATNGDINATGHQLSGFDTLSVTNGDFIAGGLSANTLTVNQTGSVNVANDLNLKNPFSGLGTVTVGGLFTAPTITAGDITVNALKTNAVTSSGVFTLGSSSLSPFSNNLVTITAPTVSLLAGAAMDGQAGTPVANPGNGQNLTINTGTFTLGAGLSLNGGDAFGPGPNSAGGGGGQLNVTSSDSITVNAPISATTGQNATNSVIAGNGGTVNLTAANTVALNDKIEVSSNTGKRLSSNGGHINVTSNKLIGTAITVGSSAQLLALLNSAAPGAGGGSITFVSAGGDINVNGATMQADRGTIDIHNNGVSGNVAIDNATLNASTIKAGALGNNGTLNIGGGSMSADSIIHLYAGGSNGTVNFTSNVTLGGNSLKTIAANTVTIFDGVHVTVNGNSAASVFTNNANYTGSGGNGSTTGMFTGKGATTQPFSAAHGGY